MAEKSNEKIIFGILINRVKTTRKTPCDNLENGCNGYAGIHYAWGLGKAQAISYS